jgi:CDP-diacylglycerol--glycerol-3-phosphate 3-phosphatidyltransferase
MHKHLPNTLTWLRIAAIPALVFFEVRGHRAAFAAGLVACLTTDVLDGLLARRFRVESPFGAYLDSTADTLVFLAAGAGVAVFYPDFVVDNVVMLGAVLAAWLFENAVALVRYGRLSSFHTYLSRAAAVALGLFVVELFAFGPSLRLLSVAAALVFVATLEELALIWLLPQWTSDVRGLYWVLKGPRVHHIDAIQQSTSR